MTTSRRTTLRTVQAASGIMAGVLGIAATLFLGAFIFSQTSPRHLALAALTMAVMGLVSLTALVSTLATTRRGDRLPVAVLWVSSLATLSVVALTFTSWGVLYVPTLVLLLIASVATTLRYRPSQLAAWLEVSLGGLGSVLGVATAGVWLTSGVIAALPQVAGRALLGAFALSALLGFVLHAWLGSRVALLFIWVCAGGLLMGSVVGFAIGGTYYLPAALLVMAGCIAATIRSASRV